MSIPCSCRLTDTLYHTVHPFLSFPTSRPTYAHSAHSLATTTYIDRAVPFCNPSVLRVACRYLSIVHPLAPAMQASTWYLNSPRHKKHETRSAISNVRSSQVTSHSCSNKSTPIRSRNLHAPLLCRSVDGNQTWSLPWNVVISNTRTRRSGSILTSTSVKRACDSRLRFVPRQNCAESSCQRWLAD